MLGQLNGGQLRRVSFDAARRPDSLSDVTNVNEPSGDDRLPLRWLIVIGLVGLALGFPLGFWFESKSKWGAEQWGPVASWFAGSLTLAAVLLALW